MKFCNYLLLTPSALVLLTNISFAQTPDQRGHIEFNSDTNQGGINLCATGQENDTCSVIVNKNGININGTVNTNQLEPNGIKILNQGDTIEWLTNSADGNNLNVDFFYNRDNVSDGWGNKLKANTFYFTNRHYGNDYEFNGNITATHDITAENSIITPQLNTTSIKLTHQSNTLNWATDSADGNNISIDFFYNLNKSIDGWGNKLKANTFYFTNRRYGNDYEFNGNITATGNIAAESNITTPQLNATSIKLTHQSNTLNWVTDSADGNNPSIDFFYNRDNTTDSWGNKLKINTFYFTNRRYGNDYEFNGNITATKNITAENNIEAVNFFEKLSTPASSSASCKAGQFTDDSNYHYVCVSDNKWKRVPLLDF